MKMTDVERKIIEQIVERIREVAEVAILAGDGGEEDFRQALASHTLSPLDREVMIYVNRQQKKFQTN